MQKNGTLWCDTAGNPIHAHGGWILRDGGTYYWYGENRSADIYVDCYKSEDLMNWTFCRHVLTVSSPCESSRVRADLTLSRDPAVDYGEASVLKLKVDDPFRRVNLERPKVLYNKKTKKYVMWLHFENGVNYLDARLAVASCDTPDGEFVYHGSFRPYGLMSRDCTLFKDDDADETAYFISTTRDNAEINIYRLSEDYLNVDALVNTVFQGEFREAPAVFKHGGKYYMLHSGVTGWDPNQCRYSYASSMEGRWCVSKDCGDETTYDSQPAFVLPLGANGKTTYLYFGDRWDKNDYFSSAYLTLPVLIDTDGELSLPYYDFFEIDVRNAAYRGKNAE